MKRLGMIVAALVFAVTVSFAQSGNSSKGMSFEQLSRYLQLEPEQKGQVSKITAYFVEQLGQPLSAEALCNNPRPAETQNALLANLKLMKKTLTKDQFRKYVALINVTRANQDVKTSNPVLDSYLADN